jgi:hypothetical protein
MKIPKQNISCRKLPYFPDSSRGETSLSAYRSLNIAGTVVPNPPTKPPMKRANTKVGVKGRTFYGGITIPLQTIDRRAFSIRALRRPAEREYFPAKKEPMTAPRGIRVLQTEIIADLVEPSHPSQYATLS